MNPICTESGHAPPLARGERGFSRESGLALITVVALLAVMSVMAISFTFALRSEEQAVRNYTHFAVVQDTSDAGAGVGRAWLGDAYRGPDGIPNSGDEKYLVESLEDPWASGFADVLSRAEGLRMVYNARRQLFVVDLDSTVLTGVAGLVEANKFCGLNRPTTMGVDEDPYGDRNGDDAPGLAGVDDDGDGGVDYEDPEVRAAINGDPMYIPEYDDDEDGMMDEDGPDTNFNAWFAVGLGIDMDGDRVGVFDECSKIHLNYTGNIVGGAGGYAHSYRDGVSTFEINPAMLFYDRLWKGPGMSGPGSDLVVSPGDAADLASRIVSYVYGNYVTTAVAPGLNAVDDDFNSINFAEGLVVVRKPWMDPQLPPPSVGNIGNQADDNLNGLIDDVREYLLNIDGVDNDGDGLTDEPDEGIDEPTEFTTKLPDLLRRTDTTLLSDDRPYETKEAMKLAAGGDLSLDLILDLDVDGSDGFVNAYVPTTVPQLRQELSRREITPFELIKDYLTVYSTSPQQVVGRGYARDRINPNYTSNLVPLASRASVDSLFSAGIDNDGDWIQLRDDVNQNGIPDSNWDGAAEVGLVKPDGSPGPAADGIDNDRDGLTDNLPEDDPNYDPGALYDDGDFNRDGIADYDPEPHVDEDPPGDANGDGEPGIGRNNLLLQAMVDVGVLTLEDVEDLADDDGDGLPDEDDPEVRAAMEDPQNDEIDNNWNSPVWRYDGIDNDGDGETDEQPNLATGELGEGVDEPGEWYIPAFDDDEDGRMDEDPPEFQLFFNLVDAIDRPIPSVDDLSLPPEQRMEPPQGPDAPLAARTIPRYSIFHVRNPLVPVAQGGHRDRLEDIRRALYEDILLDRYYAAQPKVAYRGGEAIRINEVMAVPFIRVWHDDEPDIVTSIAALPDSDNVYYVDPPPGPLFWDGSRVHLDDLWHLYHDEDHDEEAEGIDPLEGKFWIVHNYPSTGFPDVEPWNLKLPPPAGRGQSETLQVTITGIPEGNYEARLIPFPEEAGARPLGENRLQRIAVPNGVGTMGLVNSVDWGEVDASKRAGGVIRVCKSNGSACVAVADIPASASPPGIISRVIPLKAIRITEDYGGEILLQIEVFAETLGTFGFTYLELYDPDQQYVELINLAKGARPVVLNGADGDTDKAWSLRIERPDLAAATDVMLEGAIYSSDTPYNSETRGENISLVTSTGNRKNPDGTTRSSLGEIQLRLRDNYELDDSAYPDDSSDDTPDPMGTPVPPTRFQNLFLTSVAPTSDSTADLDIFRAADVFSATDPVDSTRLIMGGRAEARISLTALEDPYDAQSRRFIVDQVRVTCDTTGRQYRGFQSAERDDPFSSAYEIRVVSGGGPQPEKRFTRIRPFARLYGTEALAVEDRDLSEPFTSPGEWVYPGKPWTFEPDGDEASGGYFVAPECLGANHGDRVGTWRWILDGRLDPSTAWVSVRVFGKENVLNSRRSSGPIGWATATVYDLDTGIVLDSQGGGDLVSGGVVAPHLQWTQSDLPGTKVLELEITNAVWDEEHTSIECSTGSVGDGTCTFAYIELSTVGTMARLDDPGLDIDTLPLLGGTAGRPNGTSVYSPDAPEHWDGMMPNTGRVAFISTGMPNRPLTLDETAKMVPFLTTRHEKEVPGLININTAQRPVLLCLPWAQPPFNRTVDTTVFQRMYDFANLMTMAVTNARQEIGDFYFGGPRQPGIDDDQDGFTDEGPYRTTGDLIRALRALRWVVSADTGSPLPPSVVNWPSYGYNNTGNDLIMDEFFELFGGDTTLTRNDLGLGWMNRMEKEILARVSNLITVRSNVFEIATRGRVVTDDGQVMAESYAVQVLDRRF